VVVDVGDDGTHRLRQLLSTEPRDFLDARFVPGSAVPALEG